METKMELHAKEAKLRDLYTERRVEGENVPKAGGGEERTRVKERTRKHRSKNVLTTRVFYNLRVHLKKIRKLSKNTIVAPIAFLKVRKETSELFLLGSLPPGWFSSFLTPPFRLLHTHTHTHRIQGN